MKAVLPIALLMCSMLVAGTKLKEFQWKHRLLVIPVGGERLAASITSQQGELNERDVRVFILEGAGAKTFPANPELAEEFTKLCGLDAEKGRIYLIGKDGRTVLSWEPEEFSFEKLYGSIDAMPMRQLEMREKP